MGLKEINSQGESETVEFKGSLKLKDKIGKVVSAKELNLMVEKGILKRIGKGRTLRYELND